MTPCPYRPTATASIAASLLASLATAKTVPGNLASPLPRSTAWAGQRPTQAGPQHSQLCAQARQPAVKIKMDADNSITMLEIATDGWTPMRIATGQATRLTAKELASITGPLTTATEAMAQGKGDRRVWEHLCSALNTGRAIEAGRVVRGMAGHFDDIERVLEAIAARAGEHNTPPTWTAPALRFNEMEAVRLLAELHTFQLSQLSYGEYRAAVELAIARVRSGKGEAINLPMAWQGVTN